MKYDYRSHSETGLQTKWGKCWRRFTKKHLAIATNKSMAHRKIMEKILFTLIENRMEHGVTWIDPIK